MTLLIVGCGYVGSEVAIQYAKKYAEQHREQNAAKQALIYGLTRSSDRSSALREIGVEPIVGDWLEPGLSLPRVDHVLVSVPHRPVGELNEATHVRGLENLMTAMDCSLTKIVYLSTTGIYGDSDNEVVDETTPVSPTRIGPTLAVAAEKWLAECNFPGIQKTVLRLAGIYGPGRIPLAARLRAGEPLAVPRHGHLNLVHVADIAQVICEIFDRPMKSDVYVLSDGKPIVREAFYRELARQCGIESPQFCEPAASDPRARRATDKRINPQRIVSELNYRFLFPDYCVGLANSLASGVSF